MARRRALPPQFLRELEALESSYLASNDPIRQSGFGGGVQRWRSEREPILDAIDGDGDILDIGCANGYLLECLVTWGRERGVSLVPHGLDQGLRLIELAKRRLPEFASNFYVGNAWDWNPPHRFQYVYTLLSVPPDYLEDHLRRLHADFVARGGSLIVGAYGSRSRGLPATDVAEALVAAGLTVAGSRTVDAIKSASLRPAPTPWEIHPPIARFARVDA